MIRQVTEGDFREWLRMRMLLYPEYQPEELMSEIEKIFTDKTVVGELDYVVFVHEKHGKMLGGFIETSLRRKVSNCQSSPVGYIESLYVDENLRRNRIAHDLVKESEQWVVENKCLEFAVDTDPTEKDAMDFYFSYGFLEVERNNDEVLLKKSTKLG